MDTFDWWPEDDHSGQQLSSNINPKHTLHPRWYVLRRYDWTYLPGTHPKQRNDWPCLAHPSSSHERSLGVPSWFQATTTKPFLIPGVSKFLPRKNGYKMVEVYLFSRKGPMFCSVLAPIGSRSGHWDALGRMHSSARSSLLACAGSQGQGGSDRVQASIFTHWDTPDHL